jgi:CBS domain-containing protein
MRINKTPLEKSEKIKSITIKPNTSLLKALQIMDQLSVKLLIVCEKQKFLSVLSIGDIQRAIIKNYPVESPISVTLRSNIRIAKVGENEEVIREVMLSERIECMPIIAEDNLLYDVIFWEDLFTERFQRSETLQGIPVVIMAGGKGSRLKPITNIIPKPLIPLGDKPIMEIIIEKFRFLGIKDFYLSVNYKQEMIRFYFDNLTNKDYNLITSLSLFH